jgi:Tol biopolymer transport system component
LIVVIVPSRGGPEREIGETAIAPASLLGVGQVLAWSADSQILVVAASPAPQEPITLSAFDVVRGSRRAITTHSLKFGEDALPSVSPDGSMLAFVRLGRGVVTGGLYVQALSAGFAPVGEPRSLGGEGLLYHGVAWSASGRDVIVSSGNSGDAGIWRVPIGSPEQRERLSPAGDDSRQPSVAPQQGRLAFTRASWDENIHRVTLSAPGRTTSRSVQLIGSTRSELNAQFSPDGRRIVFESRRSGTHEIWVADEDGRNALQLTSFNGLVGGTPAWSPDGKSIAFDLRDRDGRADIYVMSARGGAPVRITNHPADDVVPSWSHDGRFIYFASVRSGNYQTWKVSPDGGEPVQVTQQGGLYAKESLDGRFIYYARIDTTPPTIWRAPVAGGEEVQIVGDLASYGNFAVSREGIYFESSPHNSPLGHIPMFAPFTRPEATIDFISFATGKISRVMTIDRVAGHGLDLSRDGRTLLFAQMDSFSEDLMLVENFR